MPKQITTAAIVAGGRGTRMGPATKDLPKPMLPVGGKPLLEHQLIWLKRSGFTEVTLCLGYKPESVMDYFKDGRNWGMALRYQIEKTPRGTAGAVRDLGAAAGGNILVVYGDLYIDMDCRKLLDFHSSHTAAATLTICATDHPLDSDLVRLNGDQIMGFYRAKPGEPHENWAGAAVWVVRPSLLNLVPAEGLSDFGRDIFPQALKHGETLMAYRSNERLLDLGTPERLDAFLKTWSQE